jgi:glucosylglycerate synthase
MVELEEIPQSARESIELIGSANVVIGVFAGSRQEEINSLVDTVQKGLSTLASPVRAVLVHSNSGAGEALALAEAKEKDSSVRVLAYPGLGPPIDAADHMHAIDAAYGATLAVGESLGARVCSVIVSDLESVTPQWVYWLVQPVLELDFDLVAPSYSHHRFENLLNSGILSPLVRALFGKRITYPLGPDFGISARLLQQFREDSSDARPSGRARLAEACAIKAICGGLEVCQADVGARVNLPVDWMNLGSVLAEILNPLFLDVERTAACWQEIRGSQAVPTFGKRPVPREDAGVVDVRRMIDSFQLGYRNLQEIWGQILPPKTLLELGRLARVTPEKFRMPDELWARIVYDFLMGHHLRTISRDHLLRAITPLYLAWVASYALELEGASQAAVDRKVEQLAMAYEAGKPYLLSRWRWPDPFNP